MGMISILNEAEQAIHLHSKTPLVVTELWLHSDNVVTIFSPTRNLVEGYRSTVYLCPLIPTQ